MTLLALVMVVAAVALVFAQLGRLRRNPTLARFRALLRYSLADARDEQIVAAQMLRGRPTLAPPARNRFDTGSWSMIGGDGLGWRGGHFYKVRSLVCSGEKLYASITGPRQDGTDGEVWVRSDDEWHPIGCRSASGWPDDVAFIDQMTIHSGALYAGTRRRLLRLRPDAGWEDAAVSLPLSGDCGPYALLSTPEGLYASMWGEPGVALLQEGGSAVRLKDPVGGWGRGVRTVYSLAHFRGQLYAGTGTGSLSGPGGLVFRYDGAQWEQIGGHGLRGSWPANNVPFVLSLKVFGDRLVAALSRVPDTPCGASTIWCFDGETWQPIGVNATPEIMARSLIANDILDFGGCLVVATGDGGHSRCRVWSLDDRQLWRDVSGPALEPIHPVPGQGTWIYTLATDGRSLYAGTAGHAGAARVYKFTPSSEG